MMRYLFKPSFWGMNSAYSPSWDAFVIAAIEAGDIYRKRQYSAIVGGRDVWTGNYPYAFGRPADVDAVRPSRATIERLADALSIAPHISDKAP